MSNVACYYVFFFQAEDGIRDVAVTGVQTCALPIWAAAGRQHAVEWAHLRAPRHEPCDPRRARADAADSGRPALDCVRDPRARRPASCAARGGAIRVVGYLEHPREGVITMNCPACGTAMTEIAVSDVKIQACKGGCGGLWVQE